MRSVGSNGVLRRTFLAVTTPGAAQGGVSCTGKELGVQRTCTPKGSTVPGGGASIAVASCNRKKRTPADALALCIASVYLARPSLLPY